MAMLDCGHEPGPGTATGGYGEDAEGKRYCYACCAAHDKADMLATGRATLYLDTNKQEVTNWPGSLRFACGPIHIGNHNIAGRRYDTWFACEGQAWHAVQYGDNTQIAHCRRVQRAS